MSRSQSSSRGASPHKAPPPPRQSTHPSQAQSPSPPHPAVGHAHSHSKRLLMPTVRPVFLHSAIETTSPPSLPVPPSTPPRPHWPRPNPAKLMRNVSVTHAHSNSLGEAYLSQLQSSGSAKSPTPPNVGSRWVGLPLRFEIVEESLDIEGYQLFAVEKWIVQRSRAVMTVAVYTGDHSHKITMTALAPDRTLSPADAQIEFEKALDFLRQDGARPKETPNGILTVTSLANFRSDFTIVHIPSGNFLHAKEQLYTNINLLRMGCSGRGALTLEEPSETTVERFISMYHFHAFTVPLSMHARAPSLSTPPSPTKFNQLPHDRKRSLEWLSTEKHDLATRHRRLKSMSIPSASDHGQSDSAVLKPKTKDRSSFNACVLELVKLIQASLSLFDMFPVSSDDDEVVDGLLCDVTVEGLQRWVAEIGEPCLGVEPMQRVADPAAVSALLSLVLAVRNKLAIWNYIVPKDPFLHPNVFKLGLASYLNSTNATLAPHPGHANHPPPVGATNAPPVLTRTLVESIGAAHDKNRPGDPSRKMKRSLLNKLDDLTSKVEGAASGIGRVAAAATGGRLGDGEEREGRGGAGGQILSGIGSSIASGLGIGGGGAHTGGPASVLEATIDLEEFVRVVVNGKMKDSLHGNAGKDRDRGVAATVRNLWSGEVANVVKMRERKRERQRERLMSAGRKGDVYSEGDKESDRGGTDGKSTEDESEAFGRRVQKKLGSWTGLNRPKRSIDMPLLPSTSVKGPERLSDVGLSNESSSSSQRPLLPTIQSGDVEAPKFVLNGERASPTEGSTAPNTVGSTYTSLQSSLPNLQFDSTSGATASAADHQRLLETFNKRARLSLPLWVMPPQNRVFSYPISKTNKPQDEDESDGWRDGKRRMMRMTRSRPGSPSQQERASPITRSATEWYDDDVEDIGRRGKYFLTSGVRRRHSFHELASYGGTKVLTPERMRIDVELCGQLLVMWRRERHLDDALACLQAIISSICNTNASLRADYTSHQPDLALVDERARVVLAKAEDARADTDRHVQEASALRYGHAQFNIVGLRRTAARPQQTVRDLRSQVFGPGGDAQRRGRGRRLPAGVRGAHGRFNRFQETLDGEGRLVDWRGRTESEAEEERRCGFDESDEETSEEEEDVVEHPGIRPIWLLNLFNNWVTWLSHATAPVAAAVKKGDGTDAPTIGDSKKPEPTGDQAKPVLPQVEQ